MHQKLKFHARTHIETMINVTVEACSTYTMTPNTACSQGNCVDGLCVPYPGWVCAGDMIDSKGMLCDYNQMIIQAMWMAVMAINVYSIFMTVFALSAHIIYEQKDKPMVSVLRTMLGMNVMRARILMLASHLLFVAVAAWKQTMSPPSIGVDIGISLMFAVGVMFFWAGANLFLWIFVEVGCGNLMLQAVAVKKLLKIAHGSLCVCSVTPLISATMSSFVRAPAEAVRFYMIFWSVHYCLGLVQFIIWFIVCFKYGPMLTDIMEKGQLNALLRVPHV
jgi:hypothetical protein